MIRPDKSVTKVHVGVKPVDFRRLVNGLSMIIQYDFEQDPLCGELYVFFNRQRNKVRILYWEKNGFVLYGKYLEEDKFVLPKTGEEITTITGEQLNWLLDGIDISKIKPHPIRSYQITR